MSPGTSNFTGIHATRSEPNSRESSQYSSLKQGGNACQTPNESALDNAHGERLYQGFRMDEEWADIEETELYRPGGFHPVEIGDYLDPRSRFKVYHKLGQGKNSTVWVCKDSQRKKWRAVKILVAKESTELRPELTVLRVLKNTSYDELQDNHIATPREHFWIDGPNGHHLCLVMPLLGPRLRGFTKNIDRGQPDTLKSYCFQVTKALAFLHSKKLCHGDLQPDNIFLKIDDEKLGNVCQEFDNLEPYLEPPRHWPLGTLFDEDAKPHGPSTLITPVDLSSLEQAFRTGKIVILTSSMTHLASRPPPLHPSLRGFHGPELFLGNGFSGTSSDIWSLACFLVDPKHFDPDMLDVIDRAIETSRSIQNNGLMLLFVSYNCGSMEEYRKMQEKETKGMGWPTPIERFLGKERVIDCWNSLSVPDEDGKPNQDPEPREWSCRHTRLNQCPPVDPEPVSEEDLSNVEPKVPLRRSERIRKREASKQAALPDSPIQPKRARKATSSKMTTNTEDSAPGEDGTLDKNEAEFGSAIRSSSHVQQNSESEMNTSALKKTGRKRNATEATNTQPSNMPRSDIVHTRRIGRRAEHVVHMPNEEISVLGDLLMKMFKHDPKERITADQVLKHEWFEGYNEQVINE
ncbi:kinase-like domain-containing protein [Xylariaceae sp. FL0662B]|nr:kinase-like domain-containing protein [Xylariaceae sp. FL0662B]